MAQIWQQAYGMNRGGIKMVADDRPSLQRLSDRGVRLEMTGPDTAWIIELTQDDCERIAEAIGFRRPKDLWP